MSNQSLANTILFGLSAVVGLIAWRQARRRGKRFWHGPTWHSGRWYGIGVLLGGGAVAGGCTVLVLLGRAHWSAGQPGPADIAALIVYFVMLAAVEEFLFRGLLLRGLRDLFGRTAPAVLLSAALVAIPYLLGDHVTRLTVVSALLAGVMYGTAYVVTGSVLTSAAMRMAWNVVQGPILGFTVSGDELTSHPVLTARLDGPAWLTGGDYGPEGGAVIIAVRVVVVLILCAPLIADSKNRPCTTCADSELRS